MSTPINPVSVDEIRRLAGEGRSDREIANILGCPPQVVFMRRKTNNIPSGNPKIKKIAIDIGRIADLASQGWSDKRISLELGCSTKLIQVRRREHGIEAGCPQFANAGPSSGLSGIAEGVGSVSSADAEFAKLLGNRSFEDHPKLKPSVGYGPAPLARPDERSIVGCSALMCVA